MAKGKKRNSKAVKTQPRKSLVVAIAPIRYDMRRPSKEEVAYGDRAIATSSPSWIEHVRRCAD